MLKSVWCKYPYSTVVYHSMLYREKRSTWLRPTRARARWLLPQWLFLSLRRHTNVSTHTHTFMPQSHKKRADVVGCGAEEEEKGIAPCAQHNTTHTTLASFLPATTTIREKQRGPPRKWRRQQERFLHIEGGILPPRCHLNFIDSNFSLADGVT